MDVIDALVKEIADKSNKFVDLYVSVSDNV